MIGLQDDARNASIIYKNGMKTPNFGGCFNPCSFLSINNLEHEKYLNRFDGYSLVYLSFEEIIKVTRSYYAYSLLSLLAEISGYVGLFLGICVVSKLYHLKHFNVNEIYVSYS